MMFVPLRRLPLLVGIRLPWTEMYSLYVLLSIHRARTNLSCTYGIVCVQIYVSVRASANRRVGDERGRWDTSKDTRG